MLWVQTTTQKRLCMNSVDRERVIIRTSVIGIIANVLLVIFKAAVGFAAHSIAIILDAVNNLTDMLSSLVTILGTKLAGRQADHKHPLGHGRYEYLSAMAIVAIVLYAGVTSLVEAVRKIFEPEVIDYSPVTLIVVGAAVLVKIVLGNYVSIKGKQVSSGSLVASGKDALFDAAISASVLVAAFIYIGTGINLEAYVGIGISLVIIKAGVDMLRETMDDILGHRPDPELSQGIKRTVCADADVLGAYDLLLDSFGPDLTIGAIHVEVADTMTAAQIDAMTRRIQAAVYDEHRIVLSTVGIYSHNTSDDRVATMRSTITRAVMAHDGVRQVHGFYIDIDSQQCSFDVIIDFALRERVELFDRIVDEVQMLYPDYHFDITLDRDLSD